MTARFDHKILQPMKDVGRDAILKAGELIRDRLGTPGIVERKDTFDYVTNVDRESQALIVEIIEKHFPDHRIHSEEADPPDSRSGFTWIIDPLDATTNFIHGIPFVAVSIAACFEERALVGLVLDPLRRELFHATEGAGAFLNDQRIMVREVADLKEALVATGFPFRAKHLLDPYIATFKRIFLQVSDMRRAGSAALDLAYVGAGRLDGFWEMGLGPWDVAAASLIVREAGGMVSDFWEEERYIENGHIVAGSPMVHAFLLEHARIFLAPSLESVPETR